MLEKRLIFEIHRLKHLGFSIRRIAETLVLHRNTVSRYLIDPSPVRLSGKRESKLDPFKDEIAKLLEIDSKVSTEVVLQRLAPLGFDGAKTILRTYLRSVREGKKEKRSFIRFESPPGEQCQIDWGHFGSLPYGNTTRKLYCMAVIECHSRLLYIEFTHSQRQETLHRCLLNAFRFFNGTPRELVHDNMLTAVLERDGPLIRFNEAFLAFLRPLHIVPLPCGPRRPHEKGKIEKGAIHYIRHNFFPLRSFRDLDDVQTQADLWRNTVANMRIHATTGERPTDRFRPESMNPLPGTLPDCRDQESLKVHSDFAIHFDGNTYTVPPWLIGREVIARADNRTLTVYFKDKTVATHERSWKRRERIESIHHREAARKHQSKQWLSEDLAVLMSLGDDARSYIECLAENRQPIRKSIARLLALKDEYGTQALLHALRRAAAHKAYGPDYIENILYQEMTPVRDHPPVRIENREALNRIRLDEPSLAEYDAFVVKRRKLHE